MPSSRSIDQKKLRIVLQRVPSRARSPSQKEGGHARSILFPLPTHEPGRFGDLLTQEPLERSLPYRRREIAQDISHVEYDADSEDERFVESLSARLDTMNVVDIDTFENFIDTLEKMAYERRRFDIRAHKNGQDKKPPIPQLQVNEKIPSFSEVQHVMATCPESVYSYWIAKRQRLNRALNYYYHDWPDKQFITHYFAELHPIEPAFPTSKDLKSLREEFDQLLRIVELTEKREELKRELFLEKLRRLDSSLLAVPGIEVSGFQSLLATANGLLLYDNALKGRPHFSIEQYTPIFEQLKIHAPDVDLDPLREQYFVETGDTSVWDSDCRPPLPPSPQIPNPPEDVVGSLMEDLLEEHRPEIGTDKTTVVFSRPSALGALETITMTRWVREQMLERSKASVEVLERLGSDSPPPKMARVK